MTGDSTESLVYPDFKSRHWTERGRDWNVITEPICLFIRKDGTLISFFPTISRLHLPLLERIRQNRSLIREHGVDYLLYAILDFIVDFSMSSTSHSAFPTLQRYQFEFDQLQEKLFTYAKAQYTQDLHLLRTEISGMRRLFLGMHHLGTSRPHSSI